MSLGANTALALASLIVAGGAHAAAPNALLLSGSSVAENLPAGTMVGTLSTLDADAGDTFTYVLIDNPLDAFAIDGDKLRTAAPLDFEAGAQRSVRVRTTDSSNAYLERTFTITILDRNDPPTGVSLPVSGLPEDTPIFGLVGTVSQLGDQDQGDAWTFILLDDGDGRFVLEGNQLRTAAALDHETSPYAFLSIEVIDRAGFSASSTISLAIWNRNESPTGISLSGGATPEDAGLGTVVGTLSATGDPDVGDAHTFRIVTADGPFVVDGTLLRLTGPLDYETKAVYSPLIRATDVGGRFVEVAVTIYVSNKNEPPSSVALSNARVFENASPGTLVGLVSVLDPDAGDSHALQIVGGSGGFTLANGSLTTSAVFDYEQTQTADVIIRATDSGGLKKEVTLTITIADRNEAPTDIVLSSLTVAESATSSSVVAIVSVSDPDIGDVHDLLLLQDAGGALRLDGGIVRVASPLDYERAQLLTIIIRAKDRAGLHIDRTFNIEVTDVDEPATGLTVDPSSVRENLPAGSVVGTLTPVGDPDSATGYSWVLVQNPGSYFAIQGNRLMTTKPIDFEATRSVQIRLRAVPPSGASIEQLVTIDVTDEPEPPLGINLSGTVVQEARPEGTFVANLSTTGDPDAGELYVYSLVQNPSDSFAIQGNTLVAAKVLDHESRSLYPIKLRSTDRSGLFTETAVEIRVLDVNEAPLAVALSKREIPEGSAPNTVVGKLTPVGDPDLVDSYTYTLTNNPDDRFELAGDALIARTPFNFEKDPTSYRVTAKVRDQGGLTAETSFLVIVTDVNEPPSAITLALVELLENAPAGTVVGQVQGGIDPDQGDVGTVIVAADSLLDAFDIDADRRLVTRRPLDHETSPSATVTIVLTDAGGHSVEGTWIVEIGDAPEGPTGVALDTTSVHENAAVGTVIGQLRAVGDPDLDDVHTFELAEDADLKFAIDGDTLVLADEVDYEVAARHSVSIVATDATGLSATSLLVITVLDDNDPPAAETTDFEMPAIDEDEKSPDPVSIATALESLAVVDPDGETVTLKVSALDPTHGRWQVRRDAEWATIAVGDELVASDFVRLLPAPDFSGEVVLFVRPFDGTSLGAELRFVLAVDAVNDAPRHEIPALEIEGWQEVAIDVTRAMGGPIGLLDVDASELEVALSATDGTFFLPTGNVAVVSGAVHTDEIVVSGDIAKLQAALTGLVFTPSRGYVGRTEILITSDDKGATGSGGARVTTDAIGVNVRGAPVMAVSIDGEEVSNGGTFELGTLGAGAFMTVEVLIENRGNIDLELAETGVALTLEADLEGTVVVAPRTLIAPGEATRVVLMLRALSVGPVRAGLSVSSNDPGAEAFTVKLAGRAAATADLRVSDGSRVLASGLAHVVHDLVPEQTTRFEIGLDNLGSARLELGKIGGLRATNAKIDIEEPFPLIDPGDDDVLVLYLTPSLPGAISVSLDIPTNDPDLPVFTVSIIGDAVTTPAPRLVLERVRGVLMQPGSDDDVGYGRGGEDLVLALRLINLGGRELKRGSIALTNEDSCTARTAVAAPDVLEPGHTLSFSLIVRPSITGPFGVDLGMDTATWHLAGIAIAGSAPVPADALRFYRWGAGRVTGQDVLGPVAAKTPFTAGWSLANDGPDRMQLSLPVAVARPENVEVLPLTQPEALLPAQSAQLVPFMVTALAPGSLEFDITFAGTRALHVSSEGQVGMLQLEGEAGERISPDSVLTLPLLKVGGEAVSTVFARNLGTGPLQLGTPNLEGGASCVTARAPVKSLLGPGERTSFEIVLQPVVGSFECQLTVPSDDPGFADYTVTFAARGARSAKTGCEGGTGSLVGLAFLATALLRSRAARARRTSPPCR